MRTFSLAALMSCCLALPAFPQDAKEIDLFADGLTAFRGPKLGDWFTTDAIALDPANPRRLSAKEAKGIIWVNGPKGRTNDLYTKQKFGDVDVHLEFVMAKDSNSGIKFHGHYEILFTTKGLHPEAQGREAHPGETNREHAFTPKGLQQQHRHDADVTPSG